MNENVAGVSSKAIQAKPSSEILFVSKQLDLNTRVVSRTIPMSVQAPYRVKPTRVDCENVFTRCVKRKYVCRN